MATQAAFASFISLILNQKPLLRHYFKTWKIMDGYWVIKRPIRAGCAFGRETSGRGLRSLFGRNKGLWHWQCFRTCIVSSPKTKDMLEQNYQRDPSGCNSGCSVRSCATELGVNKTGVLQSCSCSISFTVRLQLHNKNILFSVYHMLPVPSWKDVWSDCSLVYSPSGNASIGLSRLYLLKRLGGMRYCWLVRGSAAARNF